MNKTQLWTPLQLLIRIKAINPRSKCISCLLKSGNFFSKVLSFRDLGSSLVKMLHLNQKHTNQHVFFRFYLAFQVFFFRTSQIYLTIKCLNNKWMDVSLHQLLRQTNTCNERFAAKHLGQTSELWNVQFVILSKQCENLQTKAPPLSDASTVQSPGGRRRWWMVEPWVGEGPFSDVG